MNEDQPHPGAHPGELPPELTDVFDYQEGAIAPNTPKINSLMTSGVLYSVAIFGMLLTTARLAPVFEIGGIEVFLAVLAAAFLAQGSVSLIAISMFQRMMRYTEVDFAERKIRVPGNNLVPYGIPRRDIPFAEVGSVRVVSSVHSNGKSLHRFELMPYQSEKPIACISTRREGDWDPAATLAALKRLVITADTPTDAIFLSALTRVPEMPVGHASTSNKSRN